MYQNHNLVKCYVRLKISVLELKTDPSAVKPNRKVRINCDTTRGGEATMQSSSLILICQIALTDCLIAVSNKSK